MSEGDFIDDLFANRERTRADQIFEAFRGFHVANPEVWVLFKRYALIASEVRANYSANAIFERIRWHIEIETKGDEVKLNNNFRAYYARLFHVSCPHLPDFFRNRKRTSEEGDANENDVQVFNSGPPGPEEDLRKKLRNLL